MAVQSQNSKPMDIDYNHFDARFYLEHYFSLTAFDVALTEYVRFYSRFPDNSLSVLNFGGGPSLVSLIYQAEKARDYVQADYAKSSRDEVMKWVNGDPAAFSWREHVRHCLSLECKAITEMAVAEREKRMRSVFKAAIPCDIFADEIVAPESAGPYDYVICTGVLDTVCTSVASLVTSVRRLAGLVKEGRYLHIEMSYDTEEACRASYTVGDYVYAKKLKGVKLPTILEIVRAEGFTIAHLFEYTEDNEDTAEYKDHIAMIVAQKNEVQR